MPIFLAPDHHHAWSEAVLRGQALTSPGYGKSQTVYLKVALSYPDASVLFGCGRRLRCVLRGLVFKLCVEKAAFPFPGHKG